MSTYHPAVQGAFDWLLDGAAGAPDAVAVISQLMPRLREGGVPVDRFSAFVRSLHPHVYARSFYWEPEKKVEVVERLWSQTRSESFQRSLIKKLYEAPEEVRCRLGKGEKTPWTDLNALADQGFTDYLALPFMFKTGESDPVSYATRHPGGFSDADIAALRHVHRPLTRVAETLVLLRNAVNLLSTYVGRNAGERVLKGSIHRGDTESIRCVIWFSDLRGFTSLSSERTPVEVIGILNQLFDCQVPAIEAAGGEVLKFIGDGMLAIFPVGEKASAKEAGDRAVEATTRAYAELDALNARRAQAGQPTLRFGVSLHLGDVGYGNIGGANRLDFTAIGPAVNLASRIEGLTGRLEKRVLVSAALARELSAPTRPVGAYELKGVSQKQEVFELA